MNNEMAILTYEYISPVVKSRAKGMGSKAAVDATDHCKTRSSV